MFFSLGMIADQVCALRHVPVGSRGPAECAGGPDMGLGAGLQCRLSRQLRPLKIASEVPGTAPEPGQLAGDIFRPSPEGEGALLGLRPPVDCHELTLAPGQPG